METNYLIPEALLKALVAYLSSRPYQEVAQAMPALLALKPCVPEASE